MSRTFARQRILRGLLPVLLALPFLWACQAAPDETATEPVAMKSAAPSEAQVGIPPVVSINAVMVALVDHSAHHIWDLGREGHAPQSDFEWQEVEHQAMQLAAAASWVSTGGNGEADAGWVRQLPWKDHCQALADAALEALTGARAQNLDAVLKAGDDIIEVCEACHKEFKPDLPTEGIVHPHHYEE